MGVPAGALAIVLKLARSVALVLTTGSQAVLRVMDLTGWTGTISHLPSIGAAVEHCLA